LTDHLKPLYFASKARKMLGDLEGLHCFSGLKGLDSKCKECTARETFADGRLHTGHHVWRTRKGDTVHLHVITVPLRTANGSFDMVMEMAVDITQTLKLQDGLEFAHSFLETIITTSMDGIFAVDAEGDVSICNPAARKFFAIRPDEKLSHRELAGILPEGVLSRVTRKGQHVYLNFAKGRQIRAQMSAPADIAREVVEMFAPKAEKLDIRLYLDRPRAVEPAPIDYESMHECLTNLVGNAIDACQVSTYGGSQVIVRVFEKKGTTFRICLPRKRLPEVFEPESAEEQNRSTP
jgi:nitrogen fixation/metabolism regulation signal transduction histidine kinase